MNSIKVREILVDISTFLFATLFLYASYYKIREFSKFQLELNQSPITTNYSKLISIAIPLTEIIIAIGLLIGYRYDKLRYFSLLSFYFLMTAFTSYIYILLHYSFYIPCSCGGILSNMTWNQHLSFNIITTGLSLIVIFCHRNSVSNKLLI